MLQLDDAALTVPHCACLVDQKDRLYNKPMAISMATSSCVSRIGEYVQRVIGALYEHLIRTLLPCFPGTPIDIPGLIHVFR